MLKVYRDTGTFLTSNSTELPSAIIWIDLFNPTQHEKDFVQSRTGVRIPSVEALSEIESSSRLVVERGMIYLSTPVVAHADTADAFLSPLGLILTQQVLVTVRFEQFSVIDTLVERIHRDASLRSSTGVFTALLEALVDRGADVLERLGAELDKVSRTVFRGDPSKREHTVRSNAALRRVLNRVGATGDRLSLARDVLLGLSRIAPFVVSLGHEWIVPEFEARLAAVSKDVASLNDYEGHVSNKVQFLLDAILGFITIEQNDLFKVLTIVSLVGIPPTVVAGIYGMNFKFMPELSWQWGYPFGLVLILLSALVPCESFRSFRSFQEDATQIYRRGGAGVPHGIPEAGVGRVAGSIFQAAGCWAGGGGNDARNERTILPRMVRKWPMEYRGIRYDIKQGIERDEWAWVVHTPKAKEGRISGSRDEAVSVAIRSIEAWCHRHPADCKPPIIR
jgi:magnesium transporter